MENISEKNAEGSSAISAPAAAAVAVGAAGNGVTAGGPREDDDILKRRISCHPLYGLLIETHLECLKASMADIEGLLINSATQANNKITTSMPGSSDLDHFMEMYCMALSELKKAIEEPVQETTAFIDGMYFQLMELTGMGTHPTHTPPTSPGDESSRTHHDKEAQFVHDLGGSTGDYVSNDQIIDAYVSNVYLFKSTIQRVAVGNNMKGTVAYLRGVTGILCVRPIFMGRWKGRRRAGFSYDPWILPLDHKDILGGTPSMLVLIRNPPRKSCVHIFAVTKMEP